MASISTPDLSSSQTHIQNVDFKIQSSEDTNGMKLKNKLDYQTGKLLYNKFGLALYLL